MALWLPDNRLVQAPSLLGPMGKPYGPVQIDPGAKLVPDWAVLVREKNPVEMHSGTPGTWAYSTYRMNEKNGGLEGASPYSRLHDYLKWGNFPAIGLSDFAVFYVGSCYAYSTFSSPLSNNISSYQWRLNINSNGAANESGAVSFTTYAGGSTHTSKSSAFVDGEINCFLGVRRGTTVELWRNGDLLASATGTVRNVDADGRREAHTGWYNYGSYSHGGHLDMVGGFRQTVSQAQASAFSAAPYSFLTPAR